MSSRYKFHNPECIYFTTFAVKGWIDIFTRVEYKNILVENLKYCQQNKGLEIFAWCIMTNHIHLIIRAKEGFLLQDILRDYKKFTSKVLVKAIEENIEESRKDMLLKQFITPQGIRFWQKDNKPIELWSNAVITQKLNYIHQNPVKGGIVYRAEDYIYSSAIDYVGGEEMLDIILIE